MGPRRGRTEQERSPRKDHRSLSVAAPSGLAGRRVWGRREPDIHDAMLSLYPYFDSEVRSRAYEAAVTAGSDSLQAQAEADAVMVTTAIRARAADPKGRVIDAAATEAPPASAEAPRDLLRISIALYRSPVVAAARGQAAYPVTERLPSGFQ